MCLKDIGDSASAIVEEQQMAAMLATVERITRIVNRCRIYEILHTPETVDTGALENFTKSLVDLYAGILRALVDSHDLLLVRTARYVLQVIALPSMMGDVLDGLSNYEEAVQTESQGVGLRGYWFPHLISCLWASTGESHRISKVVGHLTVFFSSYHLPLVARTGRRKELMEFTLDHSKQLLMVLVCSYPRVNIALDALDEFDEENRRRLMEFLT
ncbi:hypothetical protein MKZ38_001180 [Zalerion maritima]|uniref:Uncharacterized protein n=1 Tax=Zalerion maritima TaxID=339359 RepID=A0AAD5RYV2_9PEZI|nr:hypothetical protein MKZ38_001180 [Zalerion maritima]